MGSGHGEVHVVSKQDNAKHATCKAAAPATPLSTPWSVRVEPQMIALTANNLSYARGGQMLAWWDAFPVPYSLPSPYNDTSSWGIVPAWGIAEVRSSTIHSLPTGTLLWGFWPTSSALFDLTLESAPFSSKHFVEVSPARQSLMNAYNLYSISPYPGGSDLSRWSAAYKPVWEAAYILNRYVFSSVSQPLHPSGTAAWTAGDADLTNAGVISLAASSKTGRSMAWMFQSNRLVSAQGPRYLLQVTSQPSLLRSTPPESDLKVNSVSYADLADPQVLSFIASLGLSKIVILDFGAAPATLAALNSKLQALPITITVIGVGSEAKVYAPAELKAYGAMGRDIGKIQMNTSALRDVAMRSEGAAEYFAEMERCWQRCEEEKGLGGLELDRRRGVAGEMGIDGAWRELCEGKSKGNGVVVVDL